MDEEAIYKRFEVWLDPEDQQTIKLLVDSYGFSQAGALRFGLKYFRRDQIDTGKFPYKEG